MDFNTFYNSTTKEELFNIAYQYAMLMSDENEKKALAFLKKEKKLLK